MLPWHMASGGRWVIFCCGPLIKKSCQSAERVPITAVRKEEEFSEDVGREMLGKAMEEMSCFECLQEVS